MALLMRTTSDRGPWWRAEFGKALPDLAFRLYPDIGDPAQVEYALVWDPPPGLLASLPNLKVIFSLGAGVDHLFKDPALPRHLPIVRMIDARLTAQMVEYAVLYTLRFHRQIPVYEEQQRARVWKELALKQTSDRTVGVMGLGEIGGAVARALAGLGFDVAGWSRRPKEIAGVRGFAGPQDLAGFLARSEIVICVLPLTADTAGILDARAFAAMPRGGYVINIGRGQHLVEEDLLAALDSGQLAGAALDVFRTEPLPASSPLWSHPRVLATPHIAAATDPRSSVAQIVENIRRHRQGLALLNTVDAAAGY
jgi:glyoxylate/hydroxypyruvate reductase A